MSRQLQGAVAQLKKLLEAFGRPLDWQGERTPFSFTVADIKYPAPTRDEIWATYMLAPEECTFALLCADNSTPQLDRALNAVPPLLAVADLLRSIRSRAGSAPSTAAVARFEYLFELFLQNVWGVPSVADVATSSSTSPTAESKSRGDESMMVTVIWAGWNLKYRLCLIDPELLEELNEAAAAVEIHAQQFADGTPFSRLQSQIWRALDGRSFTQENLAAELEINPSQLQRPGGIKELMEAGIVENKRSLPGYFRPDRPPRN